MRPLSEAVPKSLLSVAGRATIDRVLDHLTAANVGHAVVNLHHRAERVREHLAGRSTPRITFSDESDRLLDSGGGVRRVLETLCPRPFFVVNAISLWLDGERPALERLSRCFDGTRMDALLLLHPVSQAVGYDGAGDFHLRSEGRLARRGPDETAAYVFMGVQILQPELFAGTDAVPFSLNLLYDRAAAAGRLFGLAHDGRWLNLKTPENLEAARRALGERDVAG